MKTYELTITNNYVHTWGIEEAIREIMQNAIDSETDGNKLSVSYEDGTLEIMNYGCFLDISSLVLGNSGKHDISKYIGTYGEGFKLAIIVLIRNGIEVNIYTSGKVWKPEFRVSKKFGVETLHIDVEQDLSHEHNSITFELKGINVDDFEKIRNKNLAMLKSMGFNIGETIETEYGDILLEKRYKGMMFVNGLYVQEDNSFQYGYDFKPQYLHLDRDRKAINYYKMRELTAKAVTSQNNVQLVSTAISRNYTDVKDIITYMDSVSKEFKTNFANNFLKEHNLDEDTFVGLKKEVVVAKKEKSYVVDSEAIAELVNSGLDKEKEYREIKNKVNLLSNKERAYSYYKGSGYQDLLGFLAERKDKFTEEEQEELIELLQNISQPPYFNEIEDEVFDELFVNNEEDDEVEE